MATIQIKGEGRAFGKVDEVTVQVTVKRLNEDSAKAVSQTGARVKELRAALAEAGFDGERFKTEGLWVAEEYENVQTGGAYSRKRAGYCCREQLVFKLPYTAKALSKAVKALGGEEFALNFSVSEGENLKRRALERAYQNALADAEALAQASGKGLGALLSISNVQESRGGALMLSREAAVPLAASAIEVNPSDVSVTATVVAEWELK